jgi:hypothetical protein
MRTIKLMLLVILALSLLVAGCGKATRTTGGVKIGSFPHGRDATGSKVIVEATFFNNYKYPVEIAVNNKDFVLIPNGKRFPFKFKTHHQVRYTVRAEVDNGYDTKRTTIEVQRSGLFSYGDVIVINENFIRGACEVTGVMTNNRGWQITCWHSQSGKRWVLKPGQSTEKIKILSIPTTFHWQITDSDYQQSYFGRKTNRPTYSYTMNINQTADVYWQGKWIHWEFHLND